MSTKIYNGFKMKYLNLNEQNAFLKEIRNKFLLYCQEIYYNYMGKELTGFINHLCLMDFKREFESIENYLVYNYSRQISPAEILKKAQNNKFDRITSQEMLNWLSKDYVTTRSLMSQIVDSQIQYSEISEDIMSNDTDFSANIVIFPIINKYTLLMTYSETFTNFFRTLCDDEEFSRLYELKEYHYQNQTDEPDWISEDEWGQRKKDWEDALPTGVPIKDGMSISLVTAQTFIYYMFDKNTAEHIIKYIPCLSDRIKTIAQANAFDEYWEIYKKSNNIDTDNYGDIANAICKFKKNKDTDDEIIKLIDKKSKEISSILTDITAESLKEPLKNWVPNYAKENKIE